MNTLLQDQNKESFIRLLRAQRTAYSNAKKYQIIDLISILIAISPTILLLINYDSQKVTTIIAVIGVVWTLISIFIQSFMEKQTKIGATIQDQFDTSLFKLEPNKILVGNNIEISKLLELSNKYTKDDLNDWYSINIPPQIDNDASVLLAYKCNAIYGKAQRKKYIRFIQIAIFLYYGGMIFLALYKNTGLFDLAILLAPSIPALVFGTYTIKAQNGIIDTYEKINNTVGEMYEQYKLNSINPSKIELRQIQDLFYTQRLISNKVPDWFYRLFKTKTEELVNESIRIITTE